MGKINQMMDAARIEAENRFTISELMDIVGRISSDLIILTKEIPEIRINGQRIEQAARSLEEISKSLNIPKFQPDHIQRDTPLLPVLLASVIMGISIGISLSLLAGFLILPRMDDMESRIIQMIETRNISPTPTLGMKSKSGAGGIRK